MKPCISQATTMSTPFEADLPAFQRGGWTAVELWLTKLETYLEGHTIDELRGLLDSHEPGAGGGRGARGPAALAGGRTRDPLEPLPPPAGGPEGAASPDLDRRVRLHARALGTKTTAALPPCSARRPSWLAVSACGSHSSSRSRRRFCASLDTALALIAQCGSNHAGVCLDLFHYYTGPSKFEDLAYLSRDNLAWVQVCDLSGTPRELAGDRRPDLAG